LNRQFKFFIICTILAVHPLGYHAMASHGKSKNRKKRTLFEQKLQKSWEAFFHNGQIWLPGKRVPNIFHVANNLIRNSKNSRIGINRYSLERNLTDGKFTAKDTLVHAMDWNAQFVQMHISGFKNLSEQNIMGIGNDARNKGIEIQLDISSTDAAKFEKIFKIARLIGGVKTIRTYIRLEGTIAQMKKTAIGDLIAASGKAAELGITILLEQHEVMTAEDMIEIYEGVNRPNLRILFDFANPITAGGRSEEDMEKLLDFTAMAHVKDAISAPTPCGGSHHIAVFFI